MSERGEALSVCERETTAVGRSLTVLGIFYFGADSIYEEVARFAPFPKDKQCVHCLLCCAYVLLLCMLFSQ